MRKIPVRFKSLKVNKFSLKDNTVEVAIVFNAGSDKEIVRSFSIKEGAEEQVIRLFAETNRMIRSIHQKFDNGSIVEDLVAIKLEDEENAKKDITMFMSKVFERIRQLQNATKAEGYLARISEIEHMGIRL